MTGTIGIKIRMGSEHRRTRGMGAMKLKDRMEPRTDIVRRRMGKSMMPLLITAPLRPGIQSELLLPGVRVLFKGARIQRELLLPHPVAGPKTRAVWGIRRQFLTPQLLGEGTRSGGELPFTPSKV